LKIIITESQFSDLFIKRRFARLDQLFDEKMRYYPPCDYTYDPYYAFHDYYGDVRTAVINDIINGDLNIGWEDENIRKIDDLSEMIDKGIYEIFYDKVREYFDTTLEKGCDE
jgi:hypothetical protein